MLREKTVFIVGAGASREFNLPVGTQLAQMISQKLNINFDNWGEGKATGDHDLFDAVRQHANGDAESFQQSGWLIRDGIVLANSIDDFLDSHRHDEKVVLMGKMAIAKCIIEAERSSTLYFTIKNRDTIDFASCADTWLVKLMRILVRGVAYKDRAKVFDNSAFIIFNYDRCVEHFFIHALSRYFNIQAEEANDIVAEATIFHPYGTPGSIIERQKVHFGAARADWHTLGGAIKTYTESIDTADIKQTIVDAKKLIFLGFAYHDQNMALLADQECLVAKNIFGTAYERSDSDVSVISQQILGWFSEMYRNPMERNVHINHELTASKFFDYFSKSL